MQDFERQPKRPFWTFVADVVLDRFRRRIETLEAETKALAARFDDLERKVARQDAQLTALLRLLPPAARLLAESGMFAERRDPPTTH